MSVAADQMLFKALSPGSQYTNEQRIQAATTFLTLGNIQKTSEAVNIPKRTLQDWRNTEWWIELINRIRAEKKDEFDAGFTRIIEKCTKTIENQLDSGEVKARDAATIMGISFDKRQILNLQPTSITAKTTDINHLQAQFEEYLQAKTIEADVVHTSTTD
jgi:hypothetical protein